MDTDNQQQESSGNPLSPIEQREIMEQTIAEAHHYGRKLVNACSMISDCFQQGQQQEGIVVLGQLIEGMEWFSKAVYLTRPLHAESQIAINFGQFPEILHPLVEAMKNKDYTLLADLLCHEVQPVLHSWAEELGKGPGVSEAAS